VDPQLQTNATRLENALMGAAVRTLRRQNSICVATSGGLDSSVLAAMLARHGDVPIHLITVGAAQSIDRERARLVANHLGMPLSEIVLNRERVRSILAQLVPLVGKSRIDAGLAKEWNLPIGTEFVSPLRVAWELPIFVAAQVAARFAQRLVVGQGADEWLAGYAKYASMSAAQLAPALETDRRILREEILPIEERIASAAGVKLQYPFLDERVAVVCKSLPPEHLIHEGVRKRVLREVARRLDLPKSVVDVPKTAAQYGAGVATLLKELAEDAHQHQNEYLTGFLPQRVTGEAQVLRT
jgi:asparagine synthase (glutamine-hydrolysing)